MNSLEAARGQINEIDQEMAGLFERRMAAVETIIRYKQEHHLEILDSGREQEVIARNSQRIQNPALMDYYTDFIVHLMGLSKQYQARLLHRDTVGYQGVTGAFSDIAARHLFPHGRIASYPSFEAVFDALDQGEIAYGVIPIENSFTGDVGNVLELLWAHDCYITAIYDQPIVQNLLACKGARLEEIRQVYSHPQALAQSQKFLRDLGLEPVPYGDTALAAKYISEEGDPSKGAIASAETADLYGLEVLVPAINTSAENTTRFAVISKNLPLDGNRFSLLFALSHDPGSLAKVIQIIAQRGFNLESIKSRSMHSTPWQYFFYVEVVGRLHSPEGEALLAAIRPACSHLRALGIYDR